MLSNQVDTNRQLEEKDRDIVKRFDSFTLGFCKCGCGTQLKTVRTSEGYLKRHERFHFFPRLSGPKHYNWKGGIKVSKGYVTVLDRTNPLVNPKYPYSRQHRDVMESYLGRRLTKDEIVHHIDENPLNNDLSNLEVMTRAEHAKHHHEGNHRRDYSKCSCFICNSKNTTLSKDKGSQNLRPRWHKIKEHNNNETDQKWECHKCYLRRYRETSRRGSMG